MYDIRNKAMQEIQKQYKELKEYKENFHSTEQYKAIAQENKEKSKIINTLTNMASQL